MDFEHDFEPSQPPRRRRKTSLGIAVRKADIKASIRELLRDRETYSLIVSYGRQAKDYEELMSFMVGLAVMLIHQSLDNILRLQEVEPKTAELSLELLNAINQTMAQVSGLIRALGQAFRQELIVYSLLGDFLSHQLNAVHSSALPEQDKKDIIYRLLTSAKGYELKAQDLKKQAFEKAILSLFGVQPSELLLKDGQKADKGWDKEQILRLLREAYEG